MKGTDCKSAPAEGMEIWKRKNEQIQQQLFGGFGKYEQIKKLCGILTNDL